MEDEAKAGKNVGLAKAEIAECDAPVSLWRSPSRG